VTDVDRVVYQVWRGKDEVFFETRDPKKIHAVLNGLSWFTRPRGASGADSDSTIYLCMKTGRVRMQRLNRSRVVENYGQPLEEALVILESQKGTSMMSALDTGRKDLLDLKDKSRNP
jgi:prolyl oligopeptidase PreP (S9A serine peptidase family)